MTARACAFVGCTKTELNKWDADGRLPHLFTRVIMRKKSVECRYWAEDTLEAAKELLSVCRMLFVKRNGQVCGWSGEPGGVCFTTEMADWENGVGSWVGA